MGNNSKTLRLQKARKNLVSSTTESDVPASSSSLPPNDGMFRSFIENLPVMFYAVESAPPHRPIYISPTFKRFGYPLEDWLTKPDIWDRVIHPDDAGNILDATRSAMKKGESIDFEYRVICKDGTVLWIRDRSCFIRDDKGDPFCWQGVILDITEQRQAKDELVNRERLYRTLARTIPRTAVLLFDHDYRYTLADGQQLNIHDWSTEKFEGKTLYEVFPDDISSEWAQYYERALKGEDVVLQFAYPDGAYEVNVLPVRNESGEIFAGMVMWQDVTESRKASDALRESEINSSIITKDGVPVAVQGIARDVTERKLADEALRKTEESYRDLFENANDLIYTHDLQGNFTSLNRAGEIITGYSREEALGLNLSQVVAPEFLEAARTMIAKKVAGDRPTTYELEIISKQGQRVTLELSTRLIISDGVPVGVQGIARDITARRQAEIALHNTISLFASTFESTADGIVVMSLDQKIVTCNKKFMEMWGLDDDMVEPGTGAKMVRYIARQLKDPEQFLKGVEHLYSDPHATETALMELSDGRIYERYSQPQSMGGDPVGRVCCFRDITERSQAEERLRYYALHDTLTDLPNRVQFMNHLRQAVERADGNKYSRFAVLFLDLDRFKVINDSLGHAVGDKLLIAIAERLTSCVRPGDIVARLGGDEFTILLNRSGEMSEVVGVAERLQAKISEPFKIDNYEVFTTASIGIIVSGSVPRTAEELLRDADAAMYRAKDSGKARFEIFDQEMHARNMNLLQIETDLRHAVERNEFEALYQPIVDLVSGRVSEFEALIRWRHPVHGLIQPNEFVGVAEETGLIIQIGKWIIEESCRQIAEWQQRFGMPLSVSVNLSAKQLMHPNLTSQVKAILADTGLDPSQLKLEVTESTVMEHSEKSLKVLSELDELGIALSTDDFGTGYSSLSYLQRFPFDRLKIDRSFIDIMDRDEKSGAIVKTILMLGENLDIEVVAEGIETLAQLEKLRALGCSTGQGYLFSRPIDRKLAEELLENGGNVFQDNLLLEYPNQASVIEVSDVQ